MRYMLLIYTDPDLAAQMSPDEGHAMFGEYQAFTEGIEASGELVAGDPLQGVETATTVRVRGAKTATTDGPFAETKEVLGGFYIVDAADLDRAIELASRIPGARTGSIEVRPVMDMSGMTP